MALHPARLNRASPSRLRLEPPYLRAEAPIMELADARLPQIEDAGVRHRNAAAALGVG